MEKFIINGIEVSEEQYNRIKNIPQLSDKEIDYSDIPPLKREEIAHMRESYIHRKKIERAQMLKQAV